MPEDHWCYCRMNTMRWIRTFLDKNGPESMVSSTLLLHVIIMMMINNTNCNRIIIITIIIVQRYAWSWVSTIWSHVTIIPPIRHRWEYGCINNRLFLLPIFMYWSIQNSHIPPSPPPPTGQPPRQSISLQIEGSEDSLIILHRKIYPSDVWCSLTRSLVWPEKVELQTAVRARYQGVLFAANLSGNQGTPLVVRGRQALIACSFDKSTTERDNSNSPEWP